MIELTKKGNVYMESVPTIENVYLVKPLIDYPSFTRLQRLLGQILTNATKDGYDLSDETNITALAANINSYVPTQILNEFCREFLVIKNGVSYEANYETFKSIAPELEIWNIDNFLCKYAFFLLCFYRWSFKPIQITESIGTTIASPLLSCSITELLDYLTKLGLELTTSKTAETPSTIA